jgi:type IV pilus assembly protein PilY1
VWGGGIVHAATGAEYVSIPPFVSSGAPPLVMLVMGRDHKLYYEAYNDASDLDDDGVLDIHYTPSIDYYGYFDSYKCYEYSTGNKRFEPKKTNTDKKCVGDASSYWSGDYLNYLTMSRMDTMRKVLYGGYRSTDSASETVLQRSFIPQDAHSWGKEYTSIAVDGYDIDDYTPFTAPPVGSGLRHLFASTTLTGPTSPPLLRYALNNSNRIWKWVAKESPVADDSIQTTGVTYAGHPDGHEAFETMVNTYAQPGYSYRAGSWLDYSIRNHASERFPSASTTNFGAIDGAGNPWGTNYNPYINGSIEQNHYLAIFTGKLHITNGGTYTFGVDGDDAVEVIIDGGDDINEKIIEYPGPHGAAGLSGGIPQYTGSVNFAANSSHTIEFRMEDYEGADQYYLYWKGPDSGDVWQITPAQKFTELQLSTYRLSTPASTIVNMEVRVKVCDADIGLESNCKQYPDGNYKPIGLLQRHGETKRMYFGLMSGSYAKNTSGGVLRKAIGDISDEIETTTSGVFKTSVNGIIQTINKLRIYGYNYSSHSYNTDCGWITNGPMTEGKCRDWGNPIGEMMYETTRYFAGKNNPTSAYNYTAATTDDSALGLPKATWNNPYNKATGGFDSCSKPFMLVLSDINPNFDSDQLPGVDSNFGSGITSDLSGLDVKSLADTISAPTNEGVNGSKYIGQSGATSSSDGVCTAKGVTGLGNVRGLCPEEPTKKGGYYSAAVAYYAHINDLQTSVSDDQKITTYAVGLASPLPRIEFKVGPEEKRITLVPFGKTVANRGDSSLWSYSPTNTIVDFFVETISPTYGKFRINYEDVEQGADHDMDAIVSYEYQLIDADGNNVSDPKNATQVKISLESLWASGGYIQHLGYVISGTEDDGPYLEVRDWDTSLEDDLLSPYDTPPDGSPTGTKLQQNATRIFSPSTDSTTAVAELLPNPLWYAAKWGAFEDKDDSGTPNTQDEWDEDKDGVPDTYFYVTNPLKLEEQLNKSFADILNRASSGTAASVISNTRSGEGAIYQSVFFPERTDTTGNANTVHWVGQLHSFLVDSYGNMREDTNGNQKLDLKDDAIVVFDGGHYLSYVDVNGNGLLDSTEKSSGGTTVESDDVQYLWNSSDWLNNITDADIVTQRATYISKENKRYIFTWVDGDRNSIVSSNEIQDFTWPSSSPPTVSTISELSNPDNFYAYLNLYESSPSLSDRPTAIKNLITSTTVESPIDDPYFKEFLVKQTEREIQWIRGLDYVTANGTSSPLKINGSDIAGTEMRARKFNGKTWRLGDIAYSTPTAVGAPAEGYHLLYKDASYQAYYSQHQNRRNVIYAGANDGMLHAFNGGFYDSYNKQFCRELNSGYDPLDNSTTNDSPCVADSLSTHPDLGAELWAYVPYNLLPHLYWLTENTYSHVYYIDQKPRVFDAKIFTPDSSVHINGWGTIMVVGMRFGGATITADLNKLRGTASSPATTPVDPTMKSAFILFDITNPEAKPTLLGEITMPNMGFSTSYPTIAVMRDGDGDGSFENYATANPEIGENRWFLAFGSGPANASGDPDNSILNTAGSDQQGRFYMVDLVQLAGFNTLKSLNASGVLTAGLTPYLTLPEAKSFVSDPVTVDYDLDYNADAIYYGTVSGTAKTADLTSGWKGKLRRIVIEDKQDPRDWIADRVLIDATQPVTAAPTIAVDNADRNWVFFGTGRYFVSEDGSDVDTQSYYGIKEPVDTNGVKTWNSVDRAADLVNVTNYQVFTDANQTVNNGGVSSWTDLLNEQEAKNGWYLDFLNDNSVGFASIQVGERNLGQAALLGGVLSFTTFIPSSDICVAGGESYLWALYYQTGTSYYDSILGTTNTTFNGLTYNKSLRKISLGEGLATSPNIHVGSQDGSTVFVQTSTGDIIRVEEKNPLSTKSGKASWRLR